MMDYILVRSKRKSIALHIKDGVLTVRAPLKTSESIIEKFIFDKRSWIERKLRDGAAQRDKYADVLTGRAFLYFGERLLPVAYAKSVFTVRNGYLYVPQKFFDGEAMSDSKAQKALGSFYRRAARSYLSDRLQEIGARLGLSFGTFSLTSAKGKWGSCDAKNNIRLNWHLLLLPKELSDYVIVHELAHTVEHNHSDRFWRLVASVYPRYKEAVRCLKEVGVLIRLYL